MKPLNAEMGVSVTVMFVTEILLYLGCSDAAALSASKPKRRSRHPGTEVTTDCQSVPHHVLWQKLDLHPSSPHKRLRATTTSDNRQLLVADQPDVMDWTGAQLRQRRSSSSEISSESRSRTRRSQLAYQRLVRSIDNHGTTNSTRASAGPRSRHRLRRLRRRLSRHTSGSAAHQCHLERSWKRMSRGVFPPFVETGRCKQTTCMFGLYECTRRRYALKILRRVPRRCNPLPSVSANTTYEHVWRFAEYHVTVGCECARKRRPGRIDFKSTTTSSFQSSDD